MEKKSNKGFTLIELLVVIAIMGSILVLAITSLNRISKAKKNESYEKVKNQVEIAAKQYVETNGYLFEDLNTNGSFKTISVGELVEGDYLNILTNPVTGKKLHKCSNVIVTRKSQNKYTYKFDDTNNECQNITNIITEEKTNSPRIEIKKQCNFDSNKIAPIDNWCNKEVKYTIKGLVNGGSKITSVSAYLDANYSNLVETVEDDTLTFTRNDETSGKTLYFKVENSSGGVATGNDTYKLDKTNPTCSVIGNTTSWVNSDVTLTGTCSDALSGCRESKANKTFSDTLINNSNNNITTFYDKAGNKIDCKGKVMIDKIKPTVTINEGGKTHENRTFTLNASDNKEGSGINRTEYKIGNGNWTTYNDGNITALTSTGSMKVYARTYDNAGNASDTVEKTIICNKDKVDVNPRLNGGSSFKLTFSQLYWGSNSPSSYEYIVWNKTATNDDVTTAQNKKIKIDGKEYNYYSGIVAQEKCGNFALQKVTTISSATTGNIGITKLKNGSYYAMYYCLAVRPKRDSRNNLTEIGNYFRSTLVQPKNKNTNNTGWTIEYKHVYGS